MNNRDQIDHHGFQGGAAMGEAAVLLVEPFFLDVHAPSLPWSGCGDPIGEGVAGGGHAFPGGVTDLAYAADHIRTREDVQ